MTDDQEGAGKPGGESNATEAWTALLERSQKVSASLHQRFKDDQAFSILDPGVIGRVFLNVAQHIFADPAKLQHAQATLADQYAKLWQMTAAALKGEPTEPVIEPAKDDRRFKDDAWSQNPIFDAIKQYYLLTARWLEDLVRTADELDPQTKRKAQFYTRQLLSAIAPTNFVATNPKVLRAALESGGENLRKGFAKLLDDVEQGQGRLRIPLTDPRAFELGKNIATTPGKVIYQTELAQLIQYAPLTERVYRRPLLIVPPWINKYYVLDLQPKNSFIRWVVEQGHTVFVLSWVNPDERLVHKTFDDYMLEGPLAALDAIREATGEREVNALGYCIGGTLLACTLAHLAARDDDRVKSATFFTAMIDFREPGELGVFIDEEQIERLEQHMERKGYLEGDQMAQVFNLLRENDLIWSAFVNNYLLGKDPPPFDLLYWNSDATRMPCMMHRFYLREMYLKNRLIELGALCLAGTPIDLRRIRIPTYILSTREDHIAPWRSTFTATRIYSGPVRFVLAASGHIAGVINPPAAGKYGYWTNARKAKTPDAWLESATRHDGSWWLDWSAWVSRKGGGKVKARTPGEGGLKPIKDAPGSYVRARLGV